MATLTLTEYAFNFWMVPAIFFIMGFIPCIVEDVRTPKARIFDGVKLCLGMAAFTHSTLLINLF